MKTAKGDLPAPHVKGSRILGARLKACWHSTLHEADNNSFGILAQETEISLTDDASIYDACVAAATWRGLQVGQLRRRNLARFYSFGVVQLLETMVIMLVMARRALHFFPEYNSLLSLLGVVPDT